MLGGDDVSLHFRSGIWPQASSARRSVGEYFIIMGGDRLAIVKQINETLQFVGTDSMGVVAVRGMTEYGFGVNLGRILR